MPSSRDISKGKESAANVDYYSFMGGKFTN